MRFRPHHVRTRLMLWYVAIFGAVLILYVCAASALQFWQLTSQFITARLRMWKQLRASYISGKTVIL